MAVTELGLAAIKSGLNFLGGLGTAGATAGYNAKEAQKDRDFQERMYNQQVQDNIKFWQMQRDYSDPSAELNRIQNAGLNPLLMYGSGGMQSTLTAPQSASAPHGSTARANFQNPMEIANLELVQAQANALNAQARNQDAQAESQESYKKQLDFYNSINDDTRAVQIAIKHRDLDYLNSRIQETWNNVFQSSFVNASQMASLSLMNSIAIRQMNLNEFQVGQNVLQGWESVKSNRIQANASMKQAFAAMMNATTAAKLAPYQIGVMRETAVNLSHQNRFLKDSHDFRVGIQRYNRDLLRKDLSWKDLLYESGISHQQSQTFLNTLQSDQIFQNMEWKAIDEMMSPVNMLTGFGAGMLLKGNIGRTVVGGFGR